MDETTQTHLNNIRSSDKQARSEAYYYLIEYSKQPVDWAYEAWDDLLSGLSDKDNHVRSICSQLLCNFAISDPDARILADFDAIIEVTRDKKFVTARHCLQSMWKIGRAGDAQKTRLLDGFEARFYDCVADKNTTLIRFDIIQGMRQLYDDVGDEHIKTRALNLIKQETDLKYRKKYAKVWKDS